MQTISDRVRMKRTKLSKEGGKLLQLLQREYGMNRESAVRLIGNGEAIFGGGAANALVSNTLAERDQEILVLKSQSKRLKNQVTTLSKQLGSLIGE